ncbi:OmpA family protein [Sphingomicrobium nitratireducens]|uniref:OmpA family protein n=1 Tax=Sphingomicrobium nitratireducens TaxID=2964666 RepID=UPI00224057AE|nr:OmpA family protein [Sphingomicrobium nitratireducens]
MRISKFPVILAAGAMVATGACTTDAMTGQKRISTEAGVGTVLGALGGYLLGDVIGGKNDRTERIIGAGIGAVAGGAIGAYMDKQEQELRRETEGTGVDVIRQGDDLLLRMPAGITFGFDSSEVQPEFRSTLNEVAQTLTAYESTFIDVMGHTDSVGSDAYNQQLSQRRATAVADYLTMQGVNRARIATVGYGESQPIASNDTEEGRAQNRRVEIKVTPVSQQDVGAAGY